MVDNADKQHSSFTPNYPRNFRLGQFRCRQPKTRDVGLHALTLGSFEIGGNCARLRNQPPAGRCHDNDGGATGTRYSKCEG